MKKTWRRIVGRFQIFCCASILLYAGLGHVSSGPRGFSVLLHFFSGPWEEFLITGYDWIARVFLAFFWICFQCLLRIFLPNLFPCSSSVFMWKKLFRSHFEQKESVRIFQSCLIKSFLLWKNHETSSYRGFFC